MNDITLTSAGKDILYRNTINGGQTYWVGYYGLAYVPDQSKFDANHNELIYHAEANGGSGSADGESGDYIYNIWQSDLVNAGHSISSNSLSGLTLYDRNLAANFRYIYDTEKGCNRLVTWTTDGNAIGLSGGETPSYIRTGYKVYDGVQMGDSNNVTVAEESRIPCPAPLFYLGHGKSYTAGMNAEEFTDEIGSDWPLNAEALSSDGQPVPMVTPDMRYYFGTVARPDGSEFGAIPTSADSDPFGVIASSETRSSDDDYVDQFAEFVSISNFNKAHGHVSSEGYGINAQESCHNMSRVTKLFPIGQYEIDAKDDPSTTNPSVTEKGSLSQIKYIIDIDLRGARQSMQEYFATLEYQARDAGDERESEVEAEREEIFSGNSVNSFKFNRIGIYAVPVTIRHFYKQGDAENQKDCKATHYQVEVSPDADPILFAVIRLDEVSMSEDASFGMDRFHTEFALHLEAEADSGICKDPQVYYNLVENEAITWYQNQLLATAGLSEAVTSLGVDVAHLLNRNLSENCEGSSATQDCSEYALKDHTHDYIRNLVDGTVMEGAVRGINTKTESAASGVGKNSMQLGEDTGAFGTRDMVFGLSSTADAQSHDVVALGSTNTEISQSTHSAFLGTCFYGNEGTVDQKAIAVNVNYSIIGGAFNKLEQVEQSLIIGKYVGKENNLSNIVTSVAIGEMLTDSMWNSVVLRSNADTRDSMYNVGAISNSVVLGQGYGDSGKDITELIDINDWNAREVQNSLLCAVNRSSCLTESDYNYMKWLVSEQGETESTLLNLVIPNVYSSVMAAGGSDPIRGKIHGSIVASTGGSTFNMVQPQYIDADDKIFGYSDGDLGYDTQFNYNIALVGGSTVPTGTRSSILVGGAIKTPVKGTYNVWVGDGSGVGGTQATLLSVEEFNSLAQSGNLTTGNYVVLSKPGEHPTILVNGDYVELESDNGYNAGIVVDENLVTTYTPYVDRVATIYQTRGLATSGGDSLGTVTRKGVKGTNLSPLESGYGKISQHWAAANRISSTLVIGYGNRVGSNSTNSIILGPSFDASNIKLSDCILIGSGNLYGPYSPSTKANEVNSDGSSRLHKLNRVLALAPVSNYLLNSLFSPADMATTDYSDALLFLNSSYCIPEVVGIFPVPTCYSSFSPLDGNGQSAANTATVNCNESYFEYNPYDFDDNGKYKATGGVGQMFAGKTKTEIKAMINKPNASMIYTGGICLAGKPIGTRGDTDSQTGQPALIKLGSSAIPSAYIQAHPISSWVSDINNTPIIPKIVTGTTACPYGGRVLGILDTQEPDGTLQLGLFPTSIGCMRESDLEYDGNDTIVKYKGKSFTASGGITSEFEYSPVTIDDSNNTYVDAGSCGYVVSTETVQGVSTKIIYFYPKKGKLYCINKGNLSSGTVKLSTDESMRWGDEFCIHYSAYTIENGGYGNGVLGGPCEVTAGNIRILCRKSAYISSSSTYGQYLLLKIA